MNLVLRRGLTAAVVVAAVAALATPAAQASSTCTLKAPYKHVVYVQRTDGSYEPQEIHIGIQGELFTQVMEGLKPGEHVVTFGSFFIDSEYKLKGTAQSVSQ